MDKFYTTCGNLEFLTTALDARSAALWSLHQFLENRIDLASVDWIDPETIDRPEVIEAMLELSDTVFVSGIGFGKLDAAIIDTADLLTEWNQLLIAMTRLENIIG